MARKTALMELVELRNGDTLENLVRQSLEQGMSIEAVADRLGVTRLTLYHWMERLGAKIETNRTVLFRDDEAAAVA
jgi:transposase-like protein